MCEGLQEKLEQIEDFSVDLETRDINQRSDWFEAFQYEVPVLKWVETATHQEILIPRPSPRLTIVQLTRHLLKFLRQHGADVDA